MVMAINAVAACSIVERDAAMGAELLEELTYQFVSKLPIFRGGQIDFQIRKGRAERSSAAVRINAVHSIGNRTGT